MSINIKYVSVFMAVESFCPTPACLQTIWRHKFI